MVARDLKVPLASAGAKLKFATVDLAERMQWIFPPEVIPHAEFLDAASDHGRLTSDSTARW